MRPVGGEKEEIASNSKNEIVRVKGWPPGAPGDRSKGVLDPGVMHDPGRAESGPQGDFDEVDVGAVAGGPQGQMVCCQPEACEALPVQPQTRPRTGMGMSSGWARSAGRGAPIVPPSPHRRGAWLSPGLHLHARKHATRPGQEVDLGVGGMEAARHDSPAPQPEPPCSDTLSYTPQVVVTSREKSRGLDGQHRQTRATEEPLPCCWHGRTTRHTGAADQRTPCPGGPGVRFSWRWLPGELLPWSAGRPEPSGPPGGGSACGPRRRR